MGGAPRPPRSPPPPSAPPRRVPRRTVASPARERLTLPAAPAPRPPRAEHSSPRPRPRLATHAPYRRAPPTPPAGLGFRVSRRPSPVSAVSCLRGLPLPCPVRGARGAWAGLRIAALCPVLGVADSAPRAGGGLGPALRAPCSVLRERSRARSRAPWLRAPRSVWERNWARGAPHAPRPALRAPYREDTSPAPRTERNGALPAPCPALRTWPEPRPLPPAPCEGGAVPHAPCERGAAPYAATWCTGAVPCGDGPGARRCRKRGDSLERQTSANDQ